MKDFKTEIEMKDFVKIKRNINRNEKEFENETT